MLIKYADDPTKRLRLLDDLQQSDRLDDRQRKWLSDERKRFTTGRQGEQSAAHYIDMHFRDGQNHAVLHDLRLSSEGQTAQIDHLMFSRGWHFYLLETKNFGGNLRINAQGEFSVKYPDGKEYGIASPLEQSRRHEVVLRKVLQQIGVQSRTGQDPVFHHVVLVHPRATITRPPKDAFDTSTVIKADQFKSWQEEYIEKGLGTASILKAILNVASSETLRQNAEMLARQHRPTDPLALPDWMGPKEPVVAVAKSAASPLSHDPSIAKKLICATCGVKIDFEVGRFCWRNPKKFGGLQYCREHQAAL